MRILLANKFAHVTGGADRHCLALADVLRGRGHEVAFLSTASERNVERAGRFVTARSTHSSRDSIGLAAQPAVAAAALWNREAAAATQALLREFRPDVLHAHKLYTQLSVAPVVVAARSGVPVVQTLHDFELIAASALDEKGGRRDRDEDRFRYRLLNTATFPLRRRVHVPRVTEFVAVSRFVARAYAGAGIGAHVLPNFASVHPPQREMRPYPARRGLVFVGRLRPEKGVADVIALAERHPEVPVTIAGSGVLADVVQSAAERLPNLTAAGFLDRDAVQDLLASARVTLVPSRWQEPGALTPLEAMELGTPVVAYDVGGIAEYVRDSAAGAVVRSEVDALARAALLLDGNEEAWQAASDAALAATRTTHAASRYGDRIEEVYERACARRVPRP